MQMLTSKLTVPALPPLFVPRPEVVAGLKVGLEARLTTVIAGPGYGKTMHLAWLAQQLTAPAAWLQVEDGDSDLPRFLLYLREAVFPTAGGAMPARWSSPETAIAEIATAARNRGSLVILLDDLHAASGPDVTQFVMQLARAAPPELHLFVSARPDLDLTLGRFRATRQLSEIRQANFRLNDAEASALLQHVAAHELAPAQVERAIALADGWATGLVLLGITLGRDPDFNLAMGGLPGEISNYLWEEAWTGLAPHEQQVLEFAAVAQYMTAELANGLFGAGDWDQVLERMHQGFGVLSGTTAGEFTLHPLWHRFLRDRMISQEGEAGLFAHCREAAAILSVQGRPYHAIRLYLEARAYQEAATLIAELAPAWMEPTHRLALAGALDDVPAQVLRELPWLALWAAQSGYVRGRLGDARFHAGEAARGFSRDGDLSGLVLAAALRCSLALMNGDIDTARILLDEGFAILAPGMDLLRARLLEQRWVLSRTDRPFDLDAQEQLLQEILHLYRTAPSPQTAKEAEVTDRMGVLAMERGHLNQAIALLQRSVALLGDLGVPAWESGFNLGAALSAACRFADALEIFVPMAQRSERPMRRLIGALNLLDIHITRDDPARAQDAARTALDLAGQLQTPHLAARARAELARLHRLQGEYGPAVTEAMEAVARAVNGHDRNFERDARRALAEAGLWSRSGSDGAPDLREVAPGTPEWARTAAVSGIYLLRSRNKKDREAGTDLLRQAVRELSQQSSFRSIVLRHWDLALTIAVVGLATGALPYACEEILAALENVPESVRERGINLPEPEARFLREAAAMLGDQGLATLEQLIPPHLRRQVQKAGSPPLRVRLLGRFDLRLNGEPLATKELNWRRALSLLLTLLVMPEGVSREQLLDWLWPDAGRKAGQNQLRVSLHHLRHLLEPDRPAGAPSAFLHSDAGKLMWIPDNTRVDVWDVQSGLQAAARALRRGDATAAALAYEKATARYRGDLVTDDCPWLEGTGEHLRRQMLQALSWLAEYYRYDRTDRTMHYLQRLLELEPGDEPAARDLMLLLARADRRAEAAQVYRQCRAYLEQELGIEVSPETTAVYREATRAPGVAVGGE